MTPRLSEPQQDRLLLIFSQALRSGAASLSRMLSAPLRFDSGAQCAIDELSPPEADGNGRRGFAVALEISGDLNGELVLFLGPATSHWLIEELLGSPVQNGDLTAIARSALMESGNIFASAFLTVLEDSFNLSCQLYPPQFREGARQKVLQHQLADHRITLHGGLVGAEKQHQADFFLLLDQRTEFASLFPG